LNVRAHMTAIRHTEDSRDSLYQEITDALERLCVLWKGGENQFRFIIPVICALRLEAFINVAGKLNVPDWDAKERQLSFAKKCLAICAELKIAFDPSIEPNITAIRLFELRNELVHPKMVVGSLNELISQQEYERRQNEFAGVSHPLREQLLPPAVDHLIQSTENFFQQWAKPMLRGEPHYWLTWGSTGGFALEPHVG